MGADIGAGRPRTLTISGLPGLPNVFAEEAPPAGDTRYHSSMFQHAIVFDRPGYLALLAIIPVLIWLGHRSLSSLGPVRRWLALGLRALVATAIILALADAQY